MPSTNEEDEDKGEESLDLKAIIADNENKPGVYTVKVTNVFSYKTCSIVQKDRKYGKELDERERDQTMTFTVEVK
ncbi:hypothetical protein [Brevibacillus gelatini]